MKLSPVKKLRQPNYPSTLIKHARHISATALLSASLLFGGISCGAQQHEASEIEVTSQEKQASQNRSLRTCQPQPRLSGDMIAPAVPPFHCGNNHTASMPEIRLPFQPIAGRLCGAQTAWARVRVPSQIRVQFLLQGPTTKIAMISPSGQHVFELSNNQSCVELDMEPGLWIFAARPTSVSTGNHGFELWGDLVP